MKFRILISTVANATNFEDEDEDEDEGYRVEVSGGSVEPMGLSLPDFHEGGTGPSPAPPCGLTQPTSPGSYDRFGGNSLTHQPDHWPPE
jgi:hypothetical protein